MELKESKTLRKTIARKYMVNDIFISVSQTDRKTDNGITRVLSVSGLDNPGCFGALFFGRSSERYNLPLEYHKKVKDFLNRKFYGKGVELLIDFEDVE